MLVALVLALLSVALPVYSGGWIPTAQGSAAAAVRQADAELESQGFAGERRYPSRPASGSGNGPT